MRSGAGNRSPLVPGGTRDESSLTVCATKQGAAAPLDQPRPIILRASGPTVPPIAAIPRMAANWTRLSVMR